MTATIDTKMMPSAGTCCASRRLTGSNSSGINKATGLEAALSQMALSPHNVVGIGDAENDHALLSACEASAAVANAVPLLKQKADIVTQGDHGEGVRELIEMLLADDLARIEEAAPKGAFAGTRYPAEGMKRVNL